MMNPVVRTRWANASNNGDFIWLATASGYAGLSIGDPKGRKHFLEPIVDDETLGTTVLDALAHSRWVLGAPRVGSTYSSEVEFDSDLYDLKKSAERGVTEIKTLMERYGYKTRRALFKNMISCNITQIEGMITISPTHHDKLERWSGFAKDENVENVVIPDNSTPEQIGAALRLAFRRCTGPGQIDPIE